MKELRSFGHLPLIAVADPGNGPERGQNQQRGNRSSQVP
jgi:hypothetical protein